MTAETAWLSAAVIGYSAAMLLALHSIIRGSPRYGLVLLMLTAALLTHSAAILLRWQRLDHGPYVNLFEILSSNVWSLHLAVLLACAVIPRIRPILATVLPLLYVLVLWLVVAPPTESEAPVTYATVWLAVHVWLGKVFLGCVVVAVGISLVILLRQLYAAAFPTLVPTRSLDELAYRFVVIGFVFESLMLVAGAIWAQDAWGRYWAWDPLETWAFITWLAVAAYLHMRITWRPSAALSALFVVCVFAIAFMTFFGLPFVSTAPHKGMI
ncbi:MAG: cytochrome c biogenesis protein CcsA [Hyphomicrobiaceae bacterium]